MYATGQKLTFLSLRVKSLIPINLLLEFKLQNKVSLTKDMDGV